MTYGWSIRLAGLTPAGLVAACLALPPAADDAPSPTAAGQPAPAAAGHAAIDWSQGDCLSQLRLLQQAASEGRLGPHDQPPFAVQLVAAPGDWLDAVPQLPIEADLPLAIDDPGAAGARCVLRIGPPRDQSAAHRAVDVQDVRSAYESGLRSERNPDYDAAQLAHREARDDAKGRHQVVRVGDPLLDLVGTTVGGLLGTLDRRVREGEVDDAAAELAATPRSRDRAVYRPYSFERVVVRAQKQAVVPVALLDAGGRELRATELAPARAPRALRAARPRPARSRLRAAPLVEHDPRRSRALGAHAAGAAPVQRRDRADRGRAGGREAPRRDRPGGGPCSARADERRARSGAVAGRRCDDRGCGLEPWLEDAFEASAPAGVARMRPGIDIAGLEQAPAPDRAASGGLEPQAASVVAIHAGRAAGHGFYVREDLVLTTYQLVGATSVVDVTTADGATVPALVAAVDPARDLALLQVPRPGPAAVLYQGAAPALALPSGGGDPGLPVLWSDQVVGMTTGASRPGHRADRRDPGLSRQPGRACSRRCPERRPPREPRRRLCRSTIVDGYRDRSNNEMSGRPIRAYPCREARLCPSRTISRGGPCDGHQGSDGKASCFDPRRRRRPRRQYRFAELETGATLAALNDALEWRGIEASAIVAVRCRPPSVAFGHRPAQYRVIYAR